MNIQFKMARNLLALALLVVVFHTVQSYGGPSLFKAWTTWRVDHGKQYSTKVEALVGWDTWVRNKRLVDEHNLAYDEGKRSFKMAMNAFADQDLGKIRSRLDIKAKLQPTEIKRRPSSPPSSSSSSIPSSWDWRKEGKVNVVRNQGQHAEDVAVNVADAVASYSAIIDQTDLYDLADQEVIDCCLTAEFVNPDVFDCINDHGGLCLNGAYHSGSPPKVCNNASCKAVASCNVGKAVTNGNESVLAEAVYSTPVVVAIDAGHPSFQLYTSGVYSDPDCSSTQLDHSLLLVGYGVTSAGTEYWICRNTWGISWGENGYINIARNHNNMCGIASDAIYPSKN